ncbi:hypothetical protein NEIFL0001_1450 [Neisseria flavescens SK114]|nr:hypothetical protein NEIFL0001_1450 [Neisseria flavescens SK114]
MLIFRIALMEGDYTFFRMARKVRIHAKGRLNQGFRRPLSTILHYGIL